MQIKHISEQEAMQRLASLTGLDISEIPMEELATTGVVPAYMVFRPSDKDIYPGKRFFFVPVDETDISAINGFETELRSLPYPLREGSTFKVAEWACFGTDHAPTLQTITYRVFALRGNGQLDPIENEHFYRVYAPQEIRQTAQNVKRYLSGKGCTITPHGYCDSGAAFDIEAVGEWRGMSPFQDAPDYASPTRRGSREKIQSSAKSRQTELVAISALLQIIKKLSAEHIGREYTQAEITAKVLELFPVGIKPRTLGGLFSDANKTREALRADARQLSAQLDEMTSPSSN